MSILQNLNQLNHTVSKFGEPKIVYKSINRDEPDIDFQLPTLLTFQVNVIIQYNYSFLRILFNHQRLIEII